MSSLPSESETTVRVQKQTVPRLVDKAVVFCQALSGRRWFPYQEEFARRVIQSVLLNDGEEISALFSRQSGKSTTISDVAVGLMVFLPMLQKLPYYEYILPDCLFKHNKMTDTKEFRYKDGFWIGIFAPALEQSESTFDKCKANVTNEGAKIILSDPDVGLAVSESNGNTLGLSNGSLVRCQTASPNANIESKTYHMVIIDEAQDVETFKVRKSIHPMLASTNGTKVKIGTPNNKKSDFYEVLHRNKRRFRLEGVQNHFEFDWRYCAKYNDEYAKYVDGERKALGDQSDEFQMAYCLKWIMERGMFITRELLCGTPEDRWAGIGQDYEPEQFNKKGRHVAGIDVAKSPDSTVITVLEVDFDHPEVIESKVVGSGEIITYKVFPKKLVGWLELLGDDYDQQYYRTIEFLNGFNIEHIEVDSSNGGGEALKDRLAIYYDNIIVNGYKFTLPSKSDLYKHFKQEMNSRRFAFPWSKETEEECVEVRRFVKQMENLEREFKGQHMVVKHPEGRDEHDDYPDSAALACWAARENWEDFNEMEVSDNPYYGGGRRSALAYNRKRF